MEPSGALQWKPFRHMAAYDHYQMYITEPSLI